RSEVVWSSAMMCRVRISTLASSHWPTGSPSMASSSSLVTTRSGTQRPVPSTAAQRRPPASGTAGHHQDRRALQDRFPLLVPAFGAQGQAAALRVDGGHLDGGRDAVAHI